MAVFAFCRIVQIHLLFGGSFGGSLGGSLGGKA